MKSFKSIREGNYAEPGVSEIDDVPEDPMSFVEIKPKKTKVVKEGIVDSAANARVRIFSSIDRKKKELYKNAVKEDVQEAVTVKKANYSFGRMMTVHHGSDTSYPLHPENQQAIAKLGDGEKTSFKDETNSTVHAEREGDTVHLTRPRLSSTKTSVAHSHFNEETEQGVAEGYETEADIDKQIEFHKQGQATAQYKGSMNKMHAKKIRDLEAKKAALKQGVAEGMDPTTDSARDARGDHRGEVKKNKDGSYVATNQSGSRKIFKSEKAAEAHAKPGKEGVAEGDKKPYPKTWHDVDPKLGKQVDKMSQAEKVKKGLAHPNTLKQQGVAEASNKTLKSYLQKVSSDSMKHKADPTKRSPEKANRSVAGFAKAQNRLTKEDTVLETKGAPKGFHFTKDGKLKRGDADQDGNGGPMLRTDPLDKQRSKVPAVSEGVDFFKVWESIKPVYEAIKTTHEDPLVVTKDAEGHIHTHANLSVANAIHGTNVKHQAIHTGKPVQGGKFTFELSKHHEGALKEDAPFDPVAHKKELDQLMGKHMAAHSETTKLINAKAPQEAINKAQERNNAVKQEIRNHKDKVPKGPAPKPGSAADYYASKKPGEYTGD